MIGQLFTAPDGSEARRRLTDAIAQLEPRLPKIARLLNEAEDDVLAFYAFPAEHWPKLRSTDESVKGREASTVLMAALACGVGVVDPRAKRRIWGWCLPRSCCPV